MKNKILIFIISICLICFILVSVFLNKGSVVVTDVYNPKLENMKHSFNIKEEQVKLINTCYIYVDKYCSNDITTNADELNSIVNDINMILLNDLFFYGFSSSEFQNRLDSDKSYFKNGGVYGENFLKHCYYKELIIVKLKALLLLGCFDDFQKCFIAHYNLIMITKDSFPTLVSMDKTISKDNNLIEEILKCYDVIFSMKLNERDTYYVATDAIYMCDFGEIGIKKSKEYSAIRKNTKYEPNDFFYGLDSKELNKDDVCLQPIRVFV